MNKDNLSIKSQNIKHIKYENHRSRRLLWKSVEIWFINHFYQQSSFFITISCDSFSSTNICWKRKPSILSKRRHNIIDQQLSIRRMRDIIKKAGTHK